MSEFNIPNKLIRLMGMTMENTQSQVRIQSDLSDSIITKKGLRLAYLLFTLALEKAVRNAGIKTSGTIFYKTVQLLGYADDIIARSRTALREAFLSLERAAGEMGLRVNKKKTKYPTTRESKNQQRYFQINNLNFEVVQSSTYLGSLINVNNDNSTEIKKRILMANKGFLWIEEAI